MAECEWAILCEHPFRDAHQRLGMIGIFDSIAFDELPQPLRHGWLNLKFRGHPGEQVAFAVRIFSPQGDVTETPEPPPLAIGDTGSVEMSLDLMDLVLERFGRYEIEISVNEQPGLVTTLVVVRAQ
jgi:hypothetical protein